MTDVNVTPALLIILASFFAAAVGSIEFLSMRDYEREKDMLIFKDSLAKCTVTKEQVIEEIKNRE